MLKKVYTLIIFILLPVIPSAIVTLVILFLTRFTGMFKNKDLNILWEDLEKYNSNVKQDYEDFQHVQVVWKKLKKTITENNKKALKKFQAAGIMK